MKLCKSNIITSYISGPYAELNVGRFFSRKSGPFDGAGVQSTPSMRSMLKLGGSGGMPPQENLKNRYQNTGFGDILAT